MSDQAAIDLFRDIDEDLQRESPSLSIDELRVRLDRLRRLEAFYGTHPPPDEHTQPALQIAIQITEFWTAHRKELLTP
jgi:hypothetical protein